MSTKKGDLKAFLNKNKKKGGKAAEAKPEESAVQPVAQEVKAKT